MHTWKITAIKPISGGKNGNESGSNAKEISNIRMCINLAKRNLKFSMEHFIGDLSRKFVKQFHRHFQWVFCNMHLYSGGLQICAYFNPNGVRYRRYTFVMCCTICQNEWSRDSTVKMFRPIPPYDRHNNVIVDSTHDWRKYL